MCLKVQKVMWLDYLYFLATAVEVFGLTDVKWWNLNYLTWPRTWNIWTPRLSFPTTMCSRYPSRTESGFCHDTKPLEDRRLRQLACAETLMPGGPEVADRSVSHHSQTLFENRECESVSRMHNIASACKVVFRKKILNTDRLGYIPFGKHSCRWKQTGWRSYG